MSDQRERLYERLLVLRCQTGDEDAYRELVGHYGPRLRYFLLKVAARPDRVDDLAQEVWLDVLRQLPKLQDAAAFTTWMYRIAHGKAMLDIRRNGWKATSVPDLEQFADVSESTFSPEDAAAIHTAIDKLDAVHREVTVLRFLEELSYDEIAGIVGCPVGTVRSRLHHAKARLQQLLRKLDP